MNGEYSGGTAGLRRDEPDGDVEGVRLSVRLVHGSAGLPCRPQHRGVEQKSSRRRRAVEASLAILAAMLAVVSAYLGLQTALITQARNEAQTSAAAKDTDLNQLNARFDELEGVNERLRTENGQLRSQLGLPAP